MKNKKVFSSKEEAEEYNNYLLIFGKATPTEPYIESFHKKQQAKNYAANHGIWDYQIFTRKQWRKHVPN